MKIWLDSGHSKTDSGAVVGNKTESKLAMQIRDLVVKNAGDLEIEIINDDLNLKETIEVIRQEASDNDLAIAIHLNANNNPDAKGVEAYFYKDSKIAEIFTRNICRMTGQVNRGARADTETFVGSLGFLRKVPCKSVLIECGYMTNGGECWNLSDPLFQDKIAKGIVNAIKEVELQSQIYTLQQKLVALLESWIAILQGKL